MSHSGAGFLKGIALGVVTGTAIGLIAAPRTKDAKRAAGKFLRVASEVVENVGGLFN
ncbi:MAG: hypothetical protein LBN30_06620 [Oscillospiraceae bacterium]|jgi:gas vesicle protein|nr:hypothetical protein [Oscillospiraceae bacterium]